ncbi:hypothetical protein SAMN02799631_05311 [Methylobacterium sp. 174MFSha1.1]|uniref:hypothetical protein n=1 Tax=Methylobacterium sp. 174MFSha1.1 TaxID=1502749 RepID=UPI0008F3DB16|nr:hypothetical protein [Methylobacterium sp. 174MFSha1.1]SFV11607.1 hypothetical protein SAMN02799631_05311 [Methylobacterium sp. 174MFSha1.1]
MASVALQIPEHVMQQVQAVAEEEGIPLSQMLLGLITDGVDQQRKLRTMRERAARADVAAALAILDRAPDVPLDPGDELP